MLALIGSPHAALGVILHQVASTQTIPRTPQAPPAISCSWGLRQKSSLTQQECICCRGAADTKSEVFATDISDHEVCKATIDKIAEQFGRIDVLANIAGMMSLNRIEDITPQLWTKMFAVNVDGAFFLSQAALPHLRKTEGNIVNVASNTGISGAAYLSHYAATKHAVVGMTKAMAYELIKEKVRVNAVAPGGINTAMTAAPQMPEDADWDLINRIVSPRGVTEPEEVAHLIAYIASPLAHSIFGACYSIDLGLTI